MEIIGDTHHAADVRAERWFKTPRFAERQHVGTAGKRVLIVQQVVKVLAVCGDGGFMMNSQELETAVREKVPFVTLIWEDSSYGLIKWKEQEQFGGEHCYVDFSNPDFKLLAEAMHCKGYRVEKAEELIPTMEEAFKQDVPSVIVVPVDYSENMKLSEHLKEVYTKKQEAII